MVFKGKREGSFQLGTHISSVLYTSSCLTFCTLPASSTLMKKISNFKIRLRAFCQMNYEDPLAFSSWLNKKQKVKRNQKTEELLRISFLTVLLQSTKCDQIRQEKHPQATLFPHCKEERGEDLLLARDGECFVPATSSEAYNCHPFQAQTHFRISQQDQVGRWNAQRSHTQARPYLPCRKRDVTPWGLHRKTVSVAVPRPCLPPAPKAAQLPRPSPGARFGARGNRSQRLNVGAVAR